MNYKPIISSLMATKTDEDNSHAELLIANKELAFQNKEKENRAAEVVIAKAELAFQNIEEENRTPELIVANEALVSSIPVQQ